jgi:hypothetical protein
MEPLALLLICPLTDIVALLSGDGARREEH